MARTDVSKAELEQHMQLARRAFLASDDGARRAALGEGLWRYGVRFVIVLHLFSRERPEVFGPLVDATRSLFPRWLNGESLTNRADEPERRAYAARELMESGRFPSMRPLAASAVLALPAGHPQRDDEWARRLLDVHLAQARRERDTEALLETICALLDHELVSRAQADELIAEGSTKAAGAARRIPPGSW